uniref:Uncharacterized protein n=1 Tax=Coptotermes formosanus TaxID=36987 RepID=R4V2X8_COPFO|nr:hypothetical protein [Coptotermes formosanus]
MAVTTSFQVQTAFCLAVCVAYLAVTSGAPRHVPEASTALLTRLRRSRFPADLPESLNSLLDGLQGHHEKSDTLEDLLKEGEKYKRRPNGGSFSPVGSKKDGSQISSLPDFHRIPSLRNNCPTCVPDSFRWSNMN